jgi:hypothetical protein
MHSANMHDENECTKNYMPKFNYPRSKPRKQSQLQQLQNQLGINLTKEVK